MAKKIIILFIVAILLLLTIEIVALFRLKASIASYASYWKHVSTTGDLTYVALGDSAAQGIGASKPQNGYVGLLTQRIEGKTGLKVRVVNLSVSGAKIDDVINKQLPQLKNYKPDFVTVEIGANDVAGDYNSQAFREKYNELADKLPTGTVVGNMPYFGGRIRHNTQALDANAIIAQAAGRHDFPIANLQKVTRERNSLSTYAADYFHPSDRGYQNWADAFWQALAPDFQ